MTRPPWMPSHPRCPACRLPIISMSIHRQYCLAPRLLALREDRTPAMIDMGRGDEPFTVEIALAWMWRECIRVGVAA